MGDELLLGYLAIAIDVTDVEDLLAPDLQDLLWHLDAHHGVQAGHHVLHLGRVNRAPGILVVHVENPIQLVIS